MTSTTGQNLGQRLEEATVFSWQTDGDAQVIRHAVIGHRTHDHTFMQQALENRCGNAPQIHTGMPAESDPPGVVVGAMADLPERTRRLARFAEFAGLKKNFEILRFRA